MLKFKFNKCYILSFALILLTEIFIAVYVRDNFIRPYVGDALVVILIYCFMRIFLPPYRFLPLGVFIFAAGVEFAQFFSFAEILGVQDNPILSVALGSTFDIADIVCYAVGGLAVYIWQRKNNIFMGRFLMNNFSQERENFRNIKNYDDFKNFISGKSISILGLGINNLPMIAFLHECGVKNITVRDKKNVFADENITEDGKRIFSILKAMNAAVITGESYLESLNEEVIFKTPGIRRDIPELIAAEKNGSIVTSEMDVLFRICPAKIFAVTGSAGKTTTTSLIGKILEADGKTVHVGGNIGRPLLYDVRKISPDDYVVVELSSFQLFDLADSPSPNTAVITNITPNHLDWHKDMTEYAEAKKIIFQNQREEDTVVFGYDDPEVKKIIREYNGRGNVKFFSQKKPELIRASVYLTEDGYICVNDGGREEKIIRRSDILVRGEHNVPNFLAAVAVTYNHVKYSSIEKTARTFGGVEHRFEFVRECGGVEYINSSIDSAPSRTIATLSNFSGTRKVALIMGGRDKNLDFAPLFPYLNDMVKSVAVYGEAKEKILAAIELDGRDFEVYSAEDFTDAVWYAKSSAESGDTVLLSPGCASFDCFKNFEERGDRFKEIVNVF